MKIKAISVMPYSAYANSRPSRMLPCVITVIPCHCEVYILFCTMQKWMNCTLCERDGGGMGRVWGVIYLHWVKVFESFSYI